MLTSDSYTYKQIIFFNGHSLMCVIFLKMHQTVSIQKFLCYISFQAVNNTEINSTVDSLSTNKDNSSTFGTYRDEDVQNEQTNLPDIDTTEGSSSESIRTMSSDEQASIKILKNEDVCPCDEKINEVKFDSFSNLVR